MWGKGMPGARARVFCRKGLKLKETWKTWVLFWCPFEKYEKYGDIFENILLNISDPCVIAIFDFLLIGGFLLNSDLAVIFSKYWNYWSGRWKIRPVSLAMVLSISLVFVSRNTFRKMVFFCITVVAWGKYLQKPNCCIFEWIIFSPQIMITTRQNKEIYSDSSYIEMSRPHDGHRPSFPFGNPFRMIRPKGSYVSPKLLMLSNSFEETLAKSLKRLKPKDNSSVLSLSWMISAMESLCETHIDIKNLITELQFPVSSWEEKWIDLYLDNSVKLLDICIAFSSELSRLSQSKLLLRYALHVLDFSSKTPSPKQLEEARSILHHDWMQQIWLRSPKLENCTTILQELVGSLFLSNVKSAKGKLLMQAVYGVMVKTIFVCSIFTAAYMGSVKPLVDLEVPDKFLWSEAFKDLQVNVNGQIRRSSNGNGVVLKELEAAHSHVEKVCAMLDSNDHKEAEILKESISGLGQSCEGLSGGLVLLSKKVDEFFQIVLRGRDALLGKLRASDLNPNEQC